MSYKDGKNFRARLKQRIIYVMGGKCACCGYDKCNTALELHHLSHDKKEFTIGSNTNLGWSKVRAELPKCILVCANCHREIHAKIIDEKLLISSFDELKAQEVDMLFDAVKHRKIYYYKHCGRPVSGKTECCSFCAAIHKRVVSSPSREELKSSIRHTPFLRLESKYGVSTAAIVKWCKNYHLPCTKKEINSINDEDWANI